MERRWREMPVRPVPVDIPVPVGPRIKRLMRSLVQRVSILMAQLVKPAKRDTDVTARRRTPPMAGFRGARRVPVQQNTKIQLGKPAARPSAPVIINPATPPRPSVRRDIRWVPVRPIKIHVSETLPRPGPRLPRQPSQLIVRRLPHRAAVHREHAHIKRIMRVP